MNIPVVTIAGGVREVGATSLLFSLAWMLEEMEVGVLACDFDVEPDLTEAFLTTEDLEALWLEPDADSGDAFWRQLIGGEYEARSATSNARRITDFLWLLPGNVALTTAESWISQQWDDANAGGKQLGSADIVNRLRQGLQAEAKAVEAEIILVDATSGLGALARLSLLVADYVLVPVEMELFSIMALRKLGPALRHWRTELGTADGESVPDPGKWADTMGYVLQKSRLNHGLPCRSDFTRMNDIPEEYARHCLNDASGRYPRNPEEDPNCLVVMQNHRMLTHYAVESHKPTFRLSAGDGVFGGYAELSAKSYYEFRDLAHELIVRLDRLGKLTRDLRVKQDA